MKAKRILESKFCRFWFSVDPCGGVRLDFGRKMKLDAGTPDHQGSIQCPALIPNLMKSGVVVFSSMMEMTSTLLKNRLFRYPPPFSASAKCPTRLSYRSNMASSMLFFKGLPINKHSERFESFAVQLPAR
jgi:hypothetical protein